METATATPCARLRAGGAQQPWRWRRSWQFKPPRLLFEGGVTPYELTAPRTYDVASDRRFLMIEPTPSASTPLTIVLNWAEELRRLVPGKYNKSRFYWSVSV